MKKLFTLKNFLLLFFALVILFTSKTVSAQTLYEPFNYTVGDNIGGNTNTSPTTNNNWTTHSNSQPGTINVISGSLIYPGLTSTGNRVNLPGSNSTTPRDVNTPTNITGSPTVAYFSFLLNVTDATQLTTTLVDNGYFIMFGGTAGASVTTLFGRVAIMSTNSGANFRLGIENTSGTGAAYTELPTDLTFGTTYLVVVKYDLNGASNDIATLWVNPSSLAGAEPGGSVSNSSSSSTTPATFTSIALRNAANTPKADIDEIRAGTTYASVTGGPLSYRTKASGNWNAIGTWESSPDGTTWTAATATPDFNANTIAIRLGHSVTVTANVTIDQTTIENGGSVTVNSGDTLFINDGAGFDITVTENLSILSGGNMTLRSNASGTASIGISTGTISGNVTVERYTSNIRAWRLLGIPLSSSTQTIKTSWMEGAANISSNPNPGFGTQITTFTGDANAANFDASKPASSIRKYVTNTFTSDATHTPNTTDLITANPAYFLFVRGDRAIDRTTSGAATTATTLRVTGAINTGPVTKGTGTSFSLIPNPYPSAIDFDAVKAANASINTFYVWDATLGTVGQYRTVTITGGPTTYTYTATPGTASNSWRYIESGTAFFIPGTGTVNFTEAMKTAGVPPSSMLRVTSPNQTELAVNLNVVNADNTTSLADGVREVFDNNYSATVDNNDAKKIAGFNLNLGISSNNEILAIEKRPLPSANEVITLSLSNMAQGNYQFELQPANLSSGLTPFLKDNYLGTYTPIDLSANTKVGFTINADAASSSQNRFSIVFGKPQLVNPNSLITVYPNPVSNGVVMLQMNNMPKGIYQVRLLNALGQTILSKQINHAEGSSTETLNVNKVKGTYTIEVTKPDNSKTNSKIIIN